MKRMKHVVSAPRVLVIAEQPALPCTDGARIRTFNLLRALDEYLVDFVHFIEPGSQFIPIETQLPYCKTVATAEHENRITNWNRMRSLFSIKPNGILRNDSDKMRSCLASLPKDSYAFALVCGFNMAQYRESISASHVILDLCDSEVRHMEVRNRFVRNPGIRSYFRWQRRKVLVAMSDLASRYDRWLVISEVERRSLLNYFPNKSIYVVPNAVACRAKSEPRQATEEHLIVLSGNFDFYPNVDAALYFADSVMPLIRSERPEVSLRILGKNPPDRIRLLQTKDIEVTGFASNFFDRLLEASVFVCSLRLGTGIKNKVLEAMSLGLPVVSTRVGVEGTGAEAERHYISAETPREFLDAIKRLLDNPDLRSKIGSSGREFVLERFSPAATAAALRVALQAVGKR